MGLSPCAEAIRKKAKSAWALQIVWKQDGSRLRENSRRKKNAGRNARSATGLFPAVHSRQPKNLGATLLRKNRSVSAGRHP
jgi:hypothetical protein